jgi:hypothetical protein
MPVPAGMRRPTIARRVDHLRGLKENVIGLGRGRSPAGVSKSLTADRSAAKLLLRRMLKLLHFR